MTANINTTGLSLLEEAFEKCKALVVVCPAGAVEKFSSIIGSIKEGIVVVDPDKLKDVTSGVQTLAELISDYAQTPTSDDLEKMNELLRAKIQLESFTDKEEARLSDIRRKKKDNEKWMKRNWKKK